MYVFCYYTRYVVVDNVFKCDEKRQIYNMIFNTTQSSIIVLQLHTKLQTHTFCLVFLIICIVISYMRVCVWSQVQ